MVKKKEPKNLGEMFGVGYSTLTFGSPTSKEESETTKREPVPAFWKTKILETQRDKCAGKDCAKLHNGKKLSVNRQSDFDHIKPLALGGKHILSNLQAMCPNCHRRKTQEDRHKISEAKKKKEEREPKKGFSSGINAWSGPEI